jgi:hypothetical protein
MARTCCNLAISTSIASRISFKGLSNLFEDHNSPLALTGSAAAAIVLRSNRAMQPLICGLDVNLDAHRLLLLNKQNS